MFRRVFLSNPVVFGGLVFLGFLSRYQLFAETSIQPGTFDPPGNIEATTDPKATPPVSSAIVPALHGSDGKPFEVLISIPGCTPADGKDYSKYIVTALTGSGLSIQGSPTLQPCGLLTTLVVGTGTPAGALPLLISDGSKTVAVVAFQIVDAVPGPIPPGLSPQVDVLWNVLDPHITADTFGGWINKRYYAVELVIGNNSGFPLQIASVGFNLRDFDGSIKPLDPDCLFSNSSVDNCKLSQWRHVPTNDYHVVRATPEKEQIAGPRAYVLSIAEALTLLGTGLTPFFKNPRHQANYSTAVTLFGNPFDKGLNLVWPDLTVPELNRLDNLALHDSAVLPNNTQTRTIVFLDRHVLSKYFARQQTDHAQSEEHNSAADDEKKKGHYNPEIRDQGPCQGAEKPQRSWVMKVSGTDKKNLRPLCNNQEPQDVKYWLGDLILVGDEIEYKQRISLGTDTSKPTSPTAAKITISPTSVVDTILSNHGQKVTLTAPGGDLSTISNNPIYVNPALKLTLDSPAADKTTRTGTLVGLFNGQTPALIPVGSYALSIPYQGVDTVLNITVEHEDLTAAPIKLSDLTSPSGAAVTISTTKGDLTGETFDLDGNSIAAKVTPASVTNTITNTTNPVQSFQVTLNAPLGAKVTSITLTNSKTKVPVVIKVNQ